jgi:3-oxoacyl-[acyl-carrier-protein] synthase-1
MALKPYLGHSLGACGVAELALLAGAFSAGFLPHAPTFRDADPALGVSPLRAPIGAPDGHYLFNAFGFGGSNTALVLRKGAA